jgi:WbqC-like protein family
MAVCAIHQPNFFPWLGYFDKIATSDVFIIMDDVAYPKSGSGSGSWVNRVKVLNQSVPSWFGLPIKRESGVQLIKEVGISQKEYTTKKLLKTLEYNYKDAPMYTTYHSIIEHLFEYDTNTLADFNLNAIKILMKLLGISTKIIKQSELNHSKHSTALLIELVKAAGCDTYLCGGGAGGYQQDELFHDNGVRLLYQGFDIEKKYPKIPPDEGGLSILHHLFYGHVANLDNRVSMNETA